MSIVEKDNEETVLAENQSMASYQANVYAYILLEENTGEAISNGIKAGLEDHWDKLDEGIKELVETGRCNDFVVFQLPSGEINGQIEIPDTLSLVTLRGAGFEDDLISTTIRGGVKLGDVSCNVEGIRVFIPASQSGIAKGGDMAGMVGKTVQLKITEVNRARRRVIGSIRAVTAEARKANQEKIWSEIEVGKKYHGVVKSLTSYGAFVDIGGVDGMVHVSELSWNRIKTPADVVKVGDEIDVYVISFDPEKHKISLGYKTAEMNPWNQFMTKYNVGDVVDAKIVKLMTFGAFAEILPGVDGLIHISQIADKRIGKPEDVLTEGQDVKVKITDVDAENKRISLSIRALLEQAEEADAE